MNIRNINVQAAYTTMMIIRSKAPVRISFGTCGDTDYYTDLIGHGNGVNATIKLYSYCEIHQRKDDKIVLRSLETGQVLIFDKLEEIKFEDRALNLMKVAVLHYKNTGIEVVTYTDAPLESGLGGSASHAVSLIKAFDELNNLTKTSEEIARLAYDWERKTLGIEGGYQDQWAASHGGINYMRFENGHVKMFPLRFTEKQLEALERDICLFFIPREKEGTAVHIEQRKRSVESIPVLEMKRDNIEKLREVLNSGKFQEIGKIMHFDWKIKKQLAPSISNNRIDQIYDAAMEAGAEGGRFIGAGAGGSAIFYAPGKRQELVKALEKFGARELKYKFERKTDPLTHIEIVTKNIDHHQTVIQTLAADEKLLKTIEQIAHKLIECYRRGGKLIMFGNGGTASDSQHIVGEFVNYLRIPNRPMLNAIALTANVSVMTAIANDSSFDNVYERQIESLASHGDVVIGISTSGKAESVLRGLRKAKERDATVIYMTGATGGKISEVLEKAGLLDISLKIPSTDTMRIQETYLLANHIICEIVEKELYGS